MNNQNNFDQTLYSATNGGYQIKWTRNKIIFVILVISLMVFSTILRIFTPKNVVIKKTSLNAVNFDGTKTSILNIKFSGEKISVPDQLPISSFTILPQTADEVINALTIKYGLVQNPAVNNVWEGKNGGLLTQDQYTKEFTFFFPPDQRGVQTLSQENLIELSRSFMVNTFPNLNILFVSTKIEELANKEEINPIQNKNQKGDLLLIPFSYQINGIPVFLNNNSLMPFRLTLNKEGVLRTLRFMPNFYSFSILQNKKTINIDAALTNIKNGKASIISSYSNEIINKDIKKFKELTLQTVELEYRSDLENHLAYPFFRFSGQALNEQNTELKVEIITPAIETET